MSAEKKYDLALRNAVSSLSESATDLLKLSLAFRAFSPLVQSFQQVPYFIPENSARILLLIPACQQA